MEGVEGSPLNFMLQEIARAFNSGLFYAAIALSLSIPDVCSNAESEGEMTFKIQKRYVLWCETWVKDLVHLTAEDVWALRGGVIHQGQTFGHPKNRYERVLFILPVRENQFQIVEETNPAEKRPLLSISVQTFCEAMAAAAIAWNKTSKDDPIVKKNLEGLLRPRPNGYENFIVGTAVIA